MSEARRVALRAIEALNRADVDGLLGCMHPEVRWRVPGRPEGDGDFHGVDAVRRAVFARLPLLLEAPPRMEIEDVVAEGECVCIRARGWARTRSSSDYTNRYLLFYRVRDGRIVEVEEFCDTARAAQQVFGKRLVDAG